jgi:hypothetical protein
LGRTNAAGHKRRLDHRGDLVCTVTCDQTVGMMRRVVLLATLLVSASGLARAAESAVMTQQELVRRTQAMLDAVSSGDKAPWAKYYADDALYFDEKGRKMDKVGLMEDLTPLPKGYTGEIKVTNPQSLLLGSTAILTYDQEETETIFGQKMTARYHETDTWMYRAGRWQVVAAQVLRYYEDPAVGRADARRLDDYVGTYRLADGMEMKVVRDGDKLSLERGGKRTELLPEVTDLYFRKGQEGRILFRRDEAGRVDALLNRRNNEDVVWKKM